MRITAAFIAAAVAASAAVPAFAQSDRLSDVEYLQAARCRGLVASEALGAMDTASIDAFFAAQSKGRSTYIADKADQITADVKRAAKRAGTERKATLTAERAGVCARYAS